LRGALSRPKQRGGLLSCHRVVLAISVGSK
jgi:hypothetical protein